MKLTEQPIGFFIGSVLGSKIEKEVETAAQVQALLMVRLDLSKAMFKDPGNLYNAITKPDLMRAQLFYDFDVRPNLLNALVANARGLVDLKKGLGEQYAAVPPFGAILTNKGLGLLSPDVIEAGLLAQSSMRIMALFDGSATAFPRTKLAPNDSAELRKIGTLLNNLLEWSKENDKPIREAFVWDHYAATIRDAVASTRERLPGTTDVRTLLDAVNIAATAKTPFVSPQRPSLIAGVKRVIQRVWSRDR